MLIPSGAKIAPFILATSLSLSLTACASSSAMQQLSSIGGSSIGAIVAKAVSVSGPMGYVVGIASSAIGGIAGSKVSKLFGKGGNDSAQVDALVKALSSKQTLASENWVAANKSGAYGYAQATGPEFLTNSYATCRSFILVQYEAKAKKGFLGLGGAKFDKFKKAGEAVNNAKSTADKAGNIKNATDVAATAKQGSETVGSAKDVVSALGPQKQAVAASSTMPVRPAGSELFGTACKDAKGLWQVVKAKV